MCKYGATSLTDYCSAWKWAFDELRKRYKIKFSQTIIPFFYYLVNRNRCFALGFRICPHPLSCHVLQIRLIRYTTSGQLHYDHQPLSLRSWFYTKGSPTHCRIMREKPRMVFSQIKVHDIKVIEQFSNVKTDSILYHTLVSRAPEYLNYGEGSRQGVNTRISTATKYIELRAIHGIAYR